MLSALDQHSWTVMGKSVWAGLLDTQVPDITAICASICQLCRRAVPQMQTVNKTTTFPGWSYCPWTTATKPPSFFLPSSTHIGTLILFLCFLLRHTVCVGVMGVNIQKKVKGSNAGEQHPDRNLLPRFSLMIGIWKELRQWLYDLLSWHSWQTFQSWLKPASSLVKFYIVRTKSRVAFRVHLLFLLHRCMVNR